MVKIEYMKQYIFKFLNKAEGRNYYSIISAPDLHSAFNSFREKINIEECDLLNIWFDCSGLNDKQP